MTTPSNDQINTNNYSHYATSEDLSGLVLQEFNKAVATGERVYRLTGDSYFQNDGFMSHSAVLEHIKWWENEDGENHDDIWDSVTLID
jgi:hypothetical protein